MCRSEYILTFTRFLILIFCFQFFSVQAQDYEWWNEKHGWDRLSPWPTYMKIAPKYMGPNALPVPELKTGRVPETLSLVNASEVHFGKGNTTYNLFQHLLLPFVKGKVAAELIVVPIEYYQTDTLARDRMMSRDKDGKGFCGGDLYFGSMFQLAKENGRLPDLMLSFNIKTASGTMMKAARYTDTPGYFFDLSVSKTLGESEKAKSRVFGLIGFYSWQTYSSKHFQDDAFLYGLGYILTKGILEIKPSLGGYIGYKNNGDRPVTGRLSVKTTRESALNFLLHVQRGFIDYPYTSVRLGINWTPGFNLYL